MYPFSHRERIFEISRKSTKRIFKYKNVFENYEIIVTNNKCIFKPISV